MAAWDKDRDVIGWRAEVARISSRGIRSKWQKDALTRAQDKLRQAEAAAHAAAAASEPTTEAAA